MKIEFVEYTGAYPNLCRGTLVVKMDGKEVSFPGDYPSFWQTGGYCAFAADGQCEVCQQPWSLSPTVKDNHCKAYPDEIRKSLPELINLFNEYVPYGCCGGCT